jgi:hypothetical protein
LSAENELFDFEREADRLAGNLPLWRKPLRSILSTLFLTVDAEYSGGRFGRIHPRNPEKGATILSRTSYLYPFFVQSNPAVGQNLEDALSVLEAADFTDIKSALSYAHSCELMPFVRKGYLGVDRSDADFTLSHPSARFAYDEQRDIIATELSLTILEQQVSFQPDALLRMVNGWPHLRSDDLLVVLVEAYLFYLDGIAEDELIVESGYQRAFGFERLDFRRVRAALMALASWCIAMATAAETSSLQGDLGQSERLRRECLEWAAPLLSVNFMAGVIQGLTHVSTERVDKILEYFSDAPFQIRNIVSGDGYLAPLTRIGEGFLFSPRALLTMLPERNLLYVLNKSDRVHFDELVSDQLEPALLSQAEKRLGKIAGLQVRKNVVWDGGEIDLVGFETASNTALQVQAKAAIPPQGARMTRQVESNSLVAVQQLENFERQPATVKDELLARLFSTDCKNVRWTSAVLSRSSFGTSRAWSAIQGRAALNLSVLRRILQRVALNGAVDLSRVPEMAGRIISEAIDKSSNGWTEEKIELFGTRIKFPNLNLDFRALDRIKAD